MEIQTTSTDRTLRISVAGGTEEIEIIGTQVVGKGSPFIPQPTSDASLGVFTDRISYGIGSLVNVSVKISGTDIPLPTTSRNVAIMITDPNNSSIMSRTITTDASGSGALSFRLSDKTVEGMYTVHSTASVNGLSLSYTTTFKVEGLRAPNFGLVSITQVQATDQMGNVISSFTKEKLGFVKVVLTTNSRVDALVTVNLFDSELTSIGVASFRTKLSEGQSEMLMSFFVPSDATIGAANIYANVLSDWPTNGGTPLTGENAASIVIE